MLFAYFFWILAFLWILILKGALRAPKIKNENPKMTLFYLEILKNGVILGAFFSKNFLKFFHKSTYSNLKIQEDGVGPKSTKNEYV